MRIALVGNWPPPHGGVAVHVEGLARALRDRGEDVRVLDLGARAFAGDRRDRSVTPARGALRCARALSAAAAEGRLVHLHTNGANLGSWLVALAAGRACRPGGPRGVLTIHSGLAPAWLSGGWLRRRLAARAAAGFARVVAVSDDVAAALAAADVPAGRICVVPPFSPSLVRPAAPPAVLASFRAARTPLFAAALAPGPTYGADVLLPAFAAVRECFPRAGLALFGPGAGPEAAGGAPGVLGLGELSHGAALGVVAAADVFVRPTRADGDALSVREALALGRRVVATAAARRPDGCLLAPPGDAPALARAMIDAATAPPPRAAAPGQDPFEQLLALYALLWPSRPLPDGGRAPVRAPTF